MTPQEILHFITWHFEVGSAIDTRVSILGDGQVAWEERLKGPRFDVSARLHTRLEGHRLIAEARMEAAPGSHIFDMVLGCRLLCPPGLLSRPSLPDVPHAGTGAYFDLPEGKGIVSWGRQGTCYAAHCTPKSIPPGFAFAPYISDEPDGWRLHARVRATGGSGFRRYWMFHREIFSKTIGDGTQKVVAEDKAQSPLYRFWRQGDFRERAIQSTSIFAASSCITLPSGFPI